MQSFVDQLPALFGVVLGAAGAMASSSLTDRLRWRRDQVVRWDQRRLDAYIAFAATLKEIHAIASRLIGAERDERAANLVLLAAANVRRTQDWESLLLLGDEATVAAGRRWRDAVAQTERVARAEAGDVDAWQAAVNESDLARDTFHAAARRGLGVGGGSVEQFHHLRANR
ncbi:hypothetical protein [Dactylosporangium sp. NPDC048998]|uniref:hypothetical protein n=1 Tax=Dactylosporangium sp. NPDC048998 TaxID=3363976 RepID=UPI0037207D61